MSAGNPSSSFRALVSLAGVLATAWTLCSWSDAVAGPPSRASWDNQVILIHEGYVRPIEGRQLVPGARDDGGRLVASTMAVIEGQDSVVFVDPGFVVARSLILDALDEVDVDPEDVTHVFISHHHPDHTINAALFPNAEIVDFWATYKGDLWEDHGDNYEIDTGIKAIRTPGHSNEDASLAVETDLGTVVFSHVWWLVLEDGTLFPAADPIADDPVALKASRELVLSILDCVVPGHGAKFVNPDRPRSTCDMVSGPPILDDSDGDSDDDHEDD